MKKLIGLAVLAAVFAGFFAAGTTRADAPAAKGIKWETRVFTGFQTAVKEKKLMVVYFRQDECGTCKGKCKHCSDVDEILRGPIGAAYADKAVWVWQNVGEDDANKNVSRLMEQLSVKSVPTVVLLEVTPTAINEKGRITGRYKAEDYRKHLKTLFAGNDGPADFNPGPNWNRPGR
jgi:thioredoxin-related protein